MKDYMSGDELYRFLHISKRKMKYLLENGYIPMIDMGMKTHRYRIKYEDAQAFKRRLEKEPEYLSELTGMFNTSGPRKKTPPLLEPTEENCRAFKEYLTKRFEDKSEALMSAAAAELIGCTSQHIRGLCAEGKIWSTIVQGRFYCSKDSLITCFSSIEIVEKPNKTERYENIIKDFLNSDIHT